MPSKEIPVSCNLQLAKNKVKPLLYVNSTSTNKSTRQKDVLLFPLPVLLLLPLSAKLVFLHFAKAAATTRFSIDYKIWLNFFLKQGLIKRSAIFSQTKQKSIIRYNSILPYSIPVISLTGLNVKLCLIRHC